MRFLIYTKGERGLASLRGLLANGLTPVLCINEGEDLGIQKICAGHHIPLMTETNPRNPSHLQAVKALHVQLLVCAGYSKILPADLFASLPFGAINCHGGKLPEYRGASPVPWQIIRGETDGAAYVLRMTAGIDDGPILASESYSIASEDTARTVTDKVTAIFSRMIPGVVRAFADGNPPVGRPQQEAGACHWTRRVPEDGRILWTSSVQEVVNLIRALDDPYPGAFLFHLGKKFIIRRARPFSRRMAGVPGRFVGKSREGALVLAADGAVELLSALVDGSPVSGRDLPFTYGENF